MLNQTLILKLIIKLISLSNYNLKPKHNPNQSHDVNLDSKPNNSPYPKPNPHLNLNHTINSKLI